MTKFYIGRQSTTTPLLFWVLGSAMNKIYDIKYRHAELRSMSDWCPVFDFFLLFLVLIFLLCLIIVIYDLDVLLSMYTPSVPRSFWLMIYCYLSNIYIYIYRHAELYLCIHAYIFIHTLVGNTCNAPESLTY